MKILLNGLDDPKLSECVYVGKGDRVFANRGAEEWGFTIGKAYEIQEISPCGYLVMENDNGEIDEYTTEYFNQYQSI